MSSTNQSNPRTTDSDQQENNGARALMSSGSASSVTNSISNGQYNAGTTQTVYLGASDGALSDIKVADLCDELEKQNKIFAAGGFASQAGQLICIPRYAEIWAGGSSFLTVTFQEGQGEQASDQSPSQTKQFYSIGFNGAERNSISYTWGVQAEVRPWSYLAARPIMFIQCFDPIASGTTTSWFCKVTFTIYNYLTVAPFTRGIWRDVSKEGWDQAVKEERGIKRAKRIKDLTIPNNME